MHSPPAILAFPGNLLPYELSLATTPAMNYGIICSAAALPMFRRAPRFPLKLQWIARRNSLPQLVLYPWASS